MSRPQSFPDLAKPIEVIKVLPLPRILPSYSLFANPTAKPPTSPASINPRNSGTPPILVSARTGHIIHIANPPRAMDAASLPQMQGQSAEDELQKQQKRAQEEQARRDMLATVLDSAARERRACHALAAPPTTHRRRSR